MQASEDALDLLGRMISLDPARRISAAAALEHRYFRSAPEPTPPAQLPRPAPRVDTSLRQQLQVCGQSPPTHHCTGTDAASFNPWTAYRCRPVARNCVPSHMFVLQGTAAPQGPSALPDPAAPPAADESRAEIGEPSSRALNGTAAALRRAVGDRFDGSSGPDSGFRRFCLTGARRRSVPGGPQ